MRLGCFTFAAMRVFHLLLSCWLILLPGFSLAAECCAEEKASELSCVDEKPDTESCCLLGEACACCLQYIIVPPIAELNLLNQAIARQSIALPFSAAISFSFAIWHPPKA